MDIFGRSNKFNLMAQSPIHNQFRESPNKSSSPTKSQKKFKNFSNPNYHSAIDIAKLYSGQVNSHMKYSQFENNLLKNAVQQYKNQVDLKGSSSRVLASSGSRLRRSNSVNNSNGFNRAGISSRKGSVRPIKIQNNKIIKNPQNDNNNLKVIKADSKSLYITQSNQKQRSNQTKINDNLYENEDKIWLKSALGKKTQIVSQYSQQLQYNWAQRVRLQQEIQKYKYLINVQKKQKAKLSLKCNKLMNQNQHTYHATNIKQQQNYRLNIEIQAIQKQNNALIENIQYLNDKLQKTKNNKNDTHQQCLQLKKFVSQTRALLMEEEKFVAKLKSNVSRSYNNMENNYMNMNLLKGEKAFLMADVRIQTKGK